MLLFLKIMFTEFIAEMGDKTQLMLLAMTQRFRVRDIVIATMSAILVLNGMAVLFGGLLSQLIPEFIIKIIASLSFIYFAASAAGDEDEEEKEGQTGKNALIAIFMTFFLAELGDKTQLTAITFGANEGIKNAVTVWLACSAGLFLSDILGMLFGIVMKRNLKKEYLEIVSIVIFFVFGVSTFNEGLRISGLFDQLSIKNISALMFIISFTVCVFNYWRAKNRKTKADRGN